MVPPGRIKIETYWNVNVLVRTSVLYGIFIKIETYWNVNCVAANPCVAVNPIKIETYWNIIFIPPAKDRKLIITIQRIFTYERKTHFSR